MKHATPKPTGRTTGNSTKTTPKVSLDEAQREAGRLLSKHRVGGCGKSLVPVRSDDRKEGVTIYRHNATQKAFYGGLMQCGCVWLCPTCASKITERRRKEIEKAIIAANGENITVLFATYTFSHHYGDNLPKLIQALRDSRRKVKSGRGYKNIKEQYKIIGSIEALEVTHSRVNGWHPHSHELIFITGDVDINAIGAELSQRWTESAAKFGLTMNEHGFKLERTRGAIADYIAKFGHDPKDASKLWGASAEITKGHMKLAGQESFTPFGLLHYLIYLQSVIDSQEPTASY